MAAKFYPDVDPNPDFPAVEEKVQQFWKDERIFEASIEQRPSGDGNDFVFYDGPPFANGLPHYGHIVTGYVKDLVPRYQTMRGKRVERRFGWDCHGLPAEMQAENKMSKSMTHIRGHAVNLLDDPKEIIRAFKGAKTDSENNIVYSEAPEKAGVNNLLEIYEAATQKSKDQVLSDFAQARGYGDLKIGVAEAVIDLVTPIREQHDYLMKDIGELDRLLAQGAEVARAQAQPKVAAMKEIMGLVLPSNP